MPAIEIKPDIYWIGINDRTTDLFEGLWPIATAGVSYNSYFIDDEKKVIIDLTKAFKGDEYIAQVDELTDITKIDYIIINHMEPDHSGLMRTLLRIAPDVTILGSEKTREMLKTFYSITDNVKVVKDGDTLSLGRRTLKFISTPFIHWPETIMTYEMDQNILFSCDAFGGYGALRGGIFDAARTHSSYILPSLWTKQGVMIGAPTYEVSLFPPVSDVLKMAAHKHIKNKKAAYFGSYGWSGGALRGLKNIVEPLKWELLDVLEFVGSPSDSDIKKAEAFGRNFAEQIKKESV